MRDHFNQRHFFHWTEEMQADHSPGATGLGGNIAYR
ncbi:Uncharacterised protein [Klebsiella pneumoniae]|nr:Uncharacterised protein [Klebsiella pneumoniae]